MTEKIKLFLDGLVSPACITDQYLSVQYANYDFLDLAGISPREIRRGITIQNCLHLDIFSDTNDIVDKVLSSGEKIKLREVSGKNASEKHISLCVSIMPASLLEEGNDTIIFVFSDLTGEEDVHEKYKKLYEKEREEREKLAEFNQRLNELVDEKTNELKSAYTELSKELEIARTVQKGLLPKELPNLINMDIASTYIPTGKVGGDLYDIIITKDRKVALLIFDVSGHGVPAALIGAMAKMLFMYFIEKGGTPAQVFKAVNKRLASYIQTGHYLTAFLAYIDPSDNSMTYCRAGHAQPIIYHFQTGEVEFLNKGDLFLGHPSLLEIAKYHNETMTLNWHDKLVLYTDGLTESMNAENEMYSKNSLEDIIRKRGKLAPDKLVATIINDNKNFRKGSSLDDDLSLLCIQIGCREEVLKESGFQKEDSPGVLMLSKHEEIEGICSVILRELDKNGYPTQHFFHAHLCIHEMLANAIRHGNKYDPLKRALVFYKISLEGFSISIVDEGDGFDYTKMPNPLLPENITKEDGRGLFLITNYMDDISFNKKGNRILAKKYLKQSI